MLSETPTQASSIQSPQTNGQSEETEFDNSGFDSKVAEVFCEQISGVINAGAQSVMISVGHRAGLFDEMAKLAPSTSQQVANAAGLNERYVREWLAVMVTAGIVFYDAATKNYELPKAHAACLTRDGSLGNSAVFAQFVSLLGEVQEQTLQCLKDGGGASYGDYPCFHQIMAEDSEQTVLAAMFDHVFPLVPGIEKRLDAGIKVLDAGCGRGKALIAMAERYPNSTFIGYDLCDDAVAEANHVVAVKNLLNICFVTKDLTHFDELENYDLITSFDAVHDQKNPLNFITRIHNALKPSGIYLMQDIGGSAYLENNLDFPMASFLYAISITHCTPISIGQGGQGLGTMWGWETAKEMLDIAGFMVVDRHVLAQDPMSVWFASKKEPNHEG